MCVHVLCSVLIIFLCSLLLFPRTDETSWQDLKDHMRQSGHVLHADIITGPDNRSKGCAIVEYATAKDARRAIASLNDTVLDGRQIFVREDREGGGATPSSRGGTPRGGGGGGGRCCVFVGNLSWDAGWQDLKDHMRSAGNVAHVEVLTKPDGRSKGCAIVEYERRSEAERALRDLDGTYLLDRELFVQPDDREDGGGAGGGGGGHAAPSHEERECRIFIGNLSYETSWQDLKDFMRRAGTVARADILTGPDGRSKGCGIVEYAYKKDAARAMRELNEAELDGRTIYLQEDRPRDDRAHDDGGAARSGGGGGGRDGDGKQLYVGNLSWDTQWFGLKDHFKCCGDVDRAEVIEGQDGRAKGFGTVRFFNARDAEKAIQELDGTMLDGRKIYVRLDRQA